MINIKDKNFDEPLLFRIAQFIKNEPINIKFEHWNSKTYDPKIVKIEDKEYTVYKKMSFLQALVEIKKEECSLLYKQIKEALDNTLYDLDDVKRLKLREAAKEK